MDRYLPDILTFLAGLLAGLIPRYFKTRHEKKVQDYEFSSKLAAELNLTRDELLEAFQQLRQERQWKEKWEHKYGILLRYMMETIEYMGGRGVRPLPLPKELESDPDIVQVVVKHKDKG